jgi:hypothetical protein
MRKREEFTKTQLRRSLKICNRTLEGYLQPLKQAGYLELVGELEGNGRGPAPYIWRLTKNTGKAAPIVRRDGSIYDPNLAGEVCQAAQRIWNALRLAGAEMTPENTSAIAGVAATVVRKYLLALEQAGYLEGDGPPKGYRLAQDTGPLAPMGTRAGVFDQNLCEYCNFGGRNG